METARKLTRSASKPRQTDLKRAVSTTYYAMFNFLARECADLFIGTGAARKSLPWVQVHRALERIPVEWNISGIGEIVGAFLRGEAGEDIAEGIP